MYRTADNIFKEYLQISLNRAINAIHFSPLKMGSNILVISYPVALLHPFPFETEGTRHHAPQAAYLFHQVF